MNAAIHTFDLPREHIISCDKLNVIGGTWENSPIAFRRLPGPSFLPNQYELLRLRSQSFIQLRTGEIAVTLGQAFPLPTDNELAYDGYPIPRGTPCFRIFLMNSTQSSPDLYYYHLDSEILHVPVSAVTNHCVTMLFCDRTTSQEQKVTFFPSIEVKITNFKIVKLSPQQATSIKRKPQLETIKLKTETGIKKAKIEGEEVLVVQPPPRTPPPVVDLTSDDDDEELIFEKVSEEFSVIRNLIMLRFPPPPKCSICKLGMRDLPPHETENHNQLISIFGDDGAVVVKNKNEAICGSARNGYLLVKWAGREPVELPNAWIIWYFPKLVDEYFRYCG
jgi:hypothetical protein